MPKSDRVGSRKPRSSKIVRILESSQVERLIPRLQPEVLYQIIQHRGLEDCAEIVAAATPEQLARVFDHDLWHSAQPGLDETLDVERFGLWLDVLMETGAAVAAEKLMGVDGNLVIAALAQHMRVFDRAAIARTGFEIGNYLVEPKRTTSWDAIVALLLYLDTAHHDFFNFVMHGCRRLSNSGFEIDGRFEVPGDAEQDLFDLAFEREQRREKQGYVTPAQARAFLQLARSRRRDTAAVDRNPIASAYFRALGRIPGLVRAHDDVPSARLQEELAFVANALLAGCSIQSRSFTPDEASRAAAAIYTLGSAHAPGSELDVVRAFECGWRILYEEVCVVTANRLLSVLRDLHFVDWDIQSGIDALRIDLAKFTGDGEPWRARGALDVMMILDMPTWATLLGLIAECPVIHAAMHCRNCRTVNASDFEFISENTQLTLVRDFLDTLPTTLGRR